MQPELMDDPQLAEAPHRLALTGLSRVNWISRTVPLLWRAIRRHVAPDNRLRVLDVGCGGGDVLGGLARCANREGFDFHGTGYDISPTAVKHATATAVVGNGVQLEFHQLDCLTGPLPGDFDVGICSLFLHHLEQDEVVSLLRKLADVSRAVVVDDLIRSRASYALTWLGTRMLTRSHIVHTDGPLSVRAAFTVAEVQQLAHRAGLGNAAITRHWPFRFLLEWSRS